MKTMKQVLAEFQRMQKQLFVKVDRTSEVRTYNNGNHWSVSILVAHYDWSKNEHDVWENVEWAHCSVHSQDDEDANIKLVEEFKEKFNLK